jgi:hypothetical protein
MRAYGFPVEWLKLETGQTLVYGEVWNEKGQQLGQWTSSDIDFLRSDLKKCAARYDYRFVDAIPGFLVEKVRGKFGKTS